MTNCLYCGAPTNGTKWCPGSACKDAAYANRRSFGSEMVEAGHITDRHIAVYLETVGAVKRIAQTAEKSLNATEAACTDAESEVATCES